MLEFSTETLRYIKSLIERVVTIIFGGDFEFYKRVFSRAQIEKT